MTVSTTSSTTSPATVRVRFAPSPTGNLHIGGARTAIYNWAFARHMGGTFVLRIEDTDPERSTAANTAQILRSLRWLGLDWDEGPEAGGAYGPYLQTQRFDTYRQALKDLVDKAAVYPCFCSSEALAAKREAAYAAKRSDTGYDRTCRAIPPEAAAARIAAGEPHTWRLKVPLDHGPVAFDDLVFGHTSFPLEQLDDFILMRSDNTPTYNFVVCVDDALMRITHVIRGDDHLSNTPKQILVYEALGVPTPQFAHLSMILGPDGKRLSKRHGATSVEAYQEQGYLPAALLNYLALLGWSLDGETTVFSAEVLCQSFSLDRVSKNPAVFDEGKLAWVNQSYIKEMGAAAFVDAWLPYLLEAGLVSVASVAANRAWYEAVYPLVAERVHTLAEVTPMTAYLFGNTVALDEKSADKCLRFEGAPAVLARVTATLGGPALTWTHEAIEGALRQLPEELGLKPKVVFQAVRVATCGNMVSPPLFESLELLGRERVVARLEHAATLTGACA